MASFSIAHMVLQSSVTSHLYSGALSSVWRVLSHGVGPQTEAAPRLWSFFLLAHNFSFYYPFWVYSKSSNKCLRQNQFEVSAVVGWFVRCRAALWCSPALLRGVRANFCKVTSAEVSYLDVQNTLPVIVSVFHSNPVFWHASSPYSLIWFSLVMYIIECFLTSPRVLLWPHEFLVWMQSQTFSNALQ